MVELWKRLFKAKEAGIFLILVAIVIFLGITTEEFLTVENIFTVILNVSFIAIMSFGMTMVIITAGIDLSVGSVLGVASVVMGLLMNERGLSPFWSVVLGLLVGVGFGLANGFLITKAKLAPFISTLGMLSVGRGLAYVLSGGWPISPFPESFTIHGQGMVGPVPVPVIYMAVIGVISHIF